MWLCIFTIHLKLLRTHNYWLAQLVYVSFEFRARIKMHIKMFKNFSKQSRGKYWLQDLSQNSLFINNQHVLILLNLCVVWCCSVKCPFSVCSLSLCFPAWLWTTALEICIESFSCKILFCIWIYIHRSHRYGDDFFTWVCIHKSNKLIQFHEMGNFYCFKACLQDFKVIFQSLNIWMKWF